MCSACLEMELYFAYLNDVEAQKQLEKQKAQPWECEVTDTPQGDEAAPVPAPKQRKKTSNFTCDEPE